MKNEERIAKEYFEKERFVDIIYEPKGNRPPDFLLNKEIAVEVRRLNQFSYGKSSIKPLEDLRFKLIPKLVKLIKNFKKDEHKLSAFVSIYFGRPIKVDSKLITQIEDVLNKHSMLMESSAEYQINEFLKLKIFPSNQKFEQQYTIGTITDNNAGGFVLSIIQESMKLILKEKASKIAPFRTEYKTWWLVLIDFIGYGLNSAEVTELQMSINSNIFDRIYFISPVNASTGSYILKNKAP